MAKKEYLTVSEFAAAAGVSKQAVYQRLKGTLKPFVKVEQGHKIIDISALNYISENSDFKGFNSRLNNGVESTPHRDAAADQNNYLLQSLMEQLKEKDKQIERLQEELRCAAVAADEKDKYIQEQGRRLADLLEQSNKLHENNQILIGLANDYKAKLEEGSASSVAAADEKKGFFSRLFRG